MNENEVWMDWLKSLESDEVDNEDDLSEADNDGREWNEHEATF